jgi:hypothetical protein
MEGLIGLRAHLNLGGEQKIILTLRENTSVVQPLFNPYTD